MIEFCFDKLTAPNLVYQINNCDNTWPRTTPVRLIKYMESVGIAHRRVSIDTASTGSWYPIGIGWFDFDVDYFSLMSTWAFELLRRGTIRVLFYYHEGDNPAHIKTRLDQLCKSKSLPSNCYCFISANTAADQLDNFRYFADHEFFFRTVNRLQRLVIADSNPRAYRFTALNRIHKWWRASCMSDLEHLGILANSLWSYNTANTEIDSELDNPLELDSRPGWRERTQNLVARGPQLCDQLSSTEHNSHDRVNVDLYTQSYCHIVLETHLDADQSNGAFITEKTFKPIKFSQPFVIAGTVGSLAELRRMGYRTFDNAIDNSYDSIADNTQRWQQLLHTIEQINNEPNMLAWFERCRPDIEHNQQMFMARCSEPLNTLIKELTCH